MMIIGWRLIILAVTLATVAILASLSASPHTGSVDGAPSCGNFLAGPLRTHVSTSDCLLQAYGSGAAAQADVTTYTVEGDPIVYRVEVFASNFVKVHVDSRDRHGPQGRFDYLCAGLERPPAPYGRSALVAVGCAGPPDFLDPSGLGGVLIP